MIQLQFKKTRIIHGTHTMEEESSKLIRINIDQNKTNHHLNNIALKTFQLQVLILWNLID